MARITTIKLLAAISLLQLPICRAECSPQALEGVYSYRTEFVGPNGRCEIIGTAFLDRNGNGWNKGGRMHGACGTSGGYIPSSPVRYTVDDSCRGQLTEPAMVWNLHADGSRHITLKMKSNGSEGRVEASYDRALQANDIAAIQRGQSHWEQYQAKASASNNGNVGGHKTDSQSNFEKLPKAQQLEMGRRWYNAINDASSWQQSCCDGNNFACNKYYEYMAVAEEACGWNHPTCVTVGQMRSIFSWCRFKNSNK